MKKLTFLLLTIASMLFSKQSSAQIVFNSSQEVINYLNGSWSFYQECGGLSAGCYSSGEVGQTRKFNFVQINGGPDSIYFQYFINDTLYREGNSKIDFGQTVIGNSWRLDNVVMNYNSNDTLNPVTYEPMAIDAFDSDSVSFTIDAIDAPTDFYSRELLSLSELKYGHELKLFPNPSFGGISFLGLSCGKKYSINIYDIRGAKMYSTDLYDCKEEIYLELSAGIYFVVIQDRGHQTTEKLIIQK